MCSSFATLNQPSSRSMEGSTDLLNTEGPPLSSMGYILMTNSTEPDVQSEMEIMVTRILLAVFMFVIIVVAVVGNVVVVCAIVRTALLNHLNNYLLVSLAIADLGNAIFCMPLFVLELSNNYRWTLPHFVCGLYAAIEISFSLLSVFNLVAISCERVFLITKPMVYQRVVTEGRLVGFIIFLWVLCFLYGLFQIFWFYTSFYKQWTIDHTGRCRYLPSRSFTIFNFVLVFVVPLSIMTGAYIKIFCVVRGQMLRIKPKVTTAFEDGVSEAILKIFGGKQSRHALDMAQEYSVFTRAPYSGTKCDADTPFPCSGTSRRDSQPTRKAWTQGRRLVENGITLGTAALNDPRNYDTQQTPCKEIFGSISSSDEEDRKIKKNAEELSGLKGINTAHSLGCQFVEASSKDTVENTVKIKHNRIVVDIGSQPQCNGNPIPAVGGTLRCSVSSHNPPTGIVDETEPSPCTKLDLEAKQNPCPRDGSPVVTIITVEPPREDPCYIDFCRMDQGGNNTGTTDMPGITVNTQIMNPMNTKITEENLNLTGHKENKCSAESTINLHQQIKSQEASCQEQQKSELKAHLQLTKDQTMQEPPEQGPQDLTHVPPVFQSEGATPEDENSSVNLPGRNNSVLTHIVSSSVRIVTSPIIASHELGTTRDSFILSTCLSAPEMYGNPGNTLGRETDGDRTLYDGIHDVKSGLTKKPQSGVNPLSAGEKLGEVYSHENETGPVQITTKLINETTNVTNSKGDQQNYEITETDPGGQGMTLGDEEPSDDVFEDENLTMTTQTTAEMDRSPSESQPETQNRGIVSSQDPGAGPFLELLQSGAPSCDVQVTEVRPFGHPDMLYNKTGKKKKCSSSLAECTHRSILKSCSSTEFPLLANLNGLSETQRLQSALKKPNLVKAIDSCPLQQKCNSVQFQLYDDVHLKSPKTSKAPVVCAVLLDDETTGSSEANTMETIIPNSQPQRPSENEDPQLRKLTDPPLHKHTLQWANRHFYFNHTDFPHNDSAILRRMGSFTSDTLTTRSLRQGIRLSENKAVRMTAYVIGAFTVCWVPYQICFMVRLFAPKAVSNLLWNCTTVLMFTSSALNPFIYNFYSSKFRAATKRLLHCSDNHVSPN